MRFIFLIVILMSFGSSAQSWKFRKEAMESMPPLDSVFTIDTVSASFESYEFEADSATGLRQVFLTKLWEVSRNKPDTLIESENLTRLANLATKYWKGSQYTDDKKWRKLNKYFKRASTLTVFKFNLMRQVSFRVPLVDTEKEAFYYDSKGNNGGLNLYKGKRPKTKEERESQEPLRQYSQQELLEIFIKRMDRKILADLKKGNIGFVGLSVELDKNTMYKTRIPTVRVVVVFGAKKFRNVPDRYRDDR